MAPFPDTCSVVLPMSAQDYLQERDSAAFRTLLSEVLDLGNTEIVASWDEGEIHYKEITTQPDYGRWVPKLARKYVKPEDICFSDVMQYDPVLLDKAPYRISVTSTVPLLGDKMECKRVNVIEEVDAGHCQLRVEGYITVKVFGIGRLAERIIIESTLKTLRALPAITERYNEIRSEFDREAATLDMPPRDCITISRISLIVQRPYLEEVDFEDDAPSSIGDDSMPEADVHEASPSLDDTTGAKISRTDTIYFDAREDNSWLDPEWAEALLEISAASAHDSRMTGCAIARDEQRVRARLRKLSPSHIKAVILSRRRSGELASQGRRLGRRKPGADTADKRWHRFWHRVQPRRAPLPSFTARAFHLLHLSAAVGWVTLSRHGSEGDSEGRPAVALKMDARQRAGSEGFVDKVLVKLHLRRSSPIRVTTPAAPRGTRYDVDLDHPSLGKNSFHVKIQG